MIAKVMRGRKVGGLLRYLYGAGKANEHIDPHLVASWDEDPAGLEPAMGGDGRAETRHLAGLLEQPVAAAIRSPQRPVWHCAVRTAATDRRLTDTEWRDVARDIMTRTGLAPDGDDGACRWVAVRHGDDHIHLVVTLARQDGKPARTSNDFYRLGEACRAAEQRLGLTGTAARDRTAARRPTRAESEKAGRAGLREPARVALQREVRAAASGAATAEEFLARLADAGLLVRPRLSERDRGVVTGYAVALPGDRAGDGRPVWFGGAKLAADLSWPKLAHRWPVTGPATGSDVGRSATPPWRHVSGRDRGGRLSGQARWQAWLQAATVAAAAATEMGRLAATDPAAASDLAHATADVLSATARAVEGGQGGPLTGAADAYDRAARDLYARIPARSPAGDSLRAVARLLALTGRAAKDETTQVLALVAALTQLADAVAHLRDVQDRAAQAAAARAAADQLRTARRERTPGHIPPVPPLHHLPLNSLTVHNLGVHPAVHRSPATGSSTRSSRRKVQP